MEEQEYYYDVSYRRTREGPVGFLYRSDFGSVADWLKENEGRLNFVIILRMSGSADGLQDREV